MNSRTELRVPGKGGTLLFQKVVPSYRVPIFRMLCNTLGIVVCHSLAKKTASWQSFHERMDFPNILIKSLHLGWSETNVLQNVIPTLLVCRPRVVISEFSLGYLTFWLLFLLRPLFRFRLAVWTHGIANNEMPHPFTSFRSRVERCVYNHADAVLLYSQERKRLLGTKIDRSKLFVATNTMDTTFMLHQYDDLVLKGRGLIKRELGISSRFNLIYMGRLLPEKRIDLLLESFKLLSGRFDVSLHIIGDGPEMVRVREYQADCQAIYAYGAIYDEELLGRYLFVSDMLLNPGYVGLSIVHAFCYGTPLVTCRMSATGPFHSPEIEYLHDGVNGLYCDLSAVSLADNIAGVLGEPPRLASMSDNALRTAREDCSIEKMLQGFGAMLNSLQA